MEIEQRAIHKIKKDDWVILRLLYLMLAIDPTLVRVKDVERAMQHVDKKYRKNAGFGIVYAFDLLKKEHGHENTFNDIGITSLTNLQKTVDIHREYTDEETKEFMQRRVFGLSRHYGSSSSAVLQDIIDAENMKLGTGNE